MKHVVVVVAPGQIGQGIARRVGRGKHVLLADMRRENTEAAVKVLENAGYELSMSTVDVSARETVRALVEWSPTSELARTPLRVPHLLVSEAGKVSVVKAAGEWSILNVNKLDAQCYATAAIVDQKIYFGAQSTSENTRSVGGFWRSPEPPI